VRIFDISEDLEMISIIGGLGYSDSASAVV